MADEEERAAKAARAKAMLKKRQQKKAAAGGGVASPTSPPPSRSFTPAPVEPDAVAASPVPTPAAAPAVEEEKRDLGDVFDVYPSDDKAGSSGGADWVRSLARAATPPPATPPLTAPRGVVSPPPSGPSEKEIALQRQVEVLQADVEALEADLGRARDLETQAKQTEEELRAAGEALETRVRELQGENDELQTTQQQTIALLVSEKASLTAELERLEDVESRARETESELEEARNTAKDLDDKVHRFRTDLAEATLRFQQSEAKQKEVSERYRETERELQLANAALSEAKRDAEKHQRAAKELREQIQNDDRLERAESSLKNTQDRVDELQFEVTKLKQKLGAAKTERDEFETSLQTLRASEEDWKSKHSSLQTEHDAIQAQLASTSTEKDSFSQEKTTLQAELVTAQQALSQLTDKFQQATSELATSSRQLQATQSELKASLRRAEDAEKTQQDLQTEGTALMRSLDEMRPKIVELTGAKVELGEQIDGLQHTLRSRDATISQLEGDLDEVRDAKERAEQRIQEMVEEREKDRALAQASSGELQKAYADLREELDLSNDSIRSLETERASHRQESAKRLDEVERLITLSNGQHDELSALRQELAEQRNAQEEEQSFLERAQNEIESLRADIASKDEEIERLRDAVASPSNTPDAQSLDHELLSSLRQQHALELSEAQSQIRALESSVFDAEAKSHALRKQLTALEDQLAQSRVSAGHAINRALSPSLQSTSSRGGAASTTARRVSGPSSLSRSLFDQNLTPETRHKRKVSLSMLKARIDSELASAQAQHSHPGSRALSPVPSGEGTSRAESPPVLVQAPQVHRPQFLAEEAHVLWCHSCRGEVFVL